MPSTNTSRIDGLMTSVAVKAPVKAVSNAPLTLSGLQTVNGVLVASGDRVLVKDQVNAVDNGIYDADSGEWTRSRDFDGNRDIVNGTRVFASYDFGFWRVHANTDLITVGTDSIQFLQTGEESKRFFHVADYGAVGDGTTDDTAAIKAACAAVNANGGGTLLFDPKTYMIYPTGTFAGSQYTMNTFVNCSGLHIDGRGATLLIQDVFVVPEQLNIFIVQSSKHITIENFNFVQTVNIQSETFETGQAPINMQLGCQFIICRNIKQIGGIIGFRTDRNTVVAPDPAQKCAWIILENWYCYRVGYAWNFQNSGDHVFARNIRTEEGYRGFFAYGVVDYDVVVTADNCYGSPPVLFYAGYGFDENSRYLEDIKIKVISNKRGIGSVSIQPILAQLVHVYYAARGTSTIVRNFDISFDVEMVADAGLGLYSVFVHGKIWNDGGVGFDAIDRGHILENLTVSGDISNCDKVGGHGAIIDLFEGTWSTGDFVSGVKVRDLIVTGTGADTHLAVNMGSIIDHLIIENVRMPTIPTFSGTTQLGTLYKNCRLGTDVYSERIHSVQVLTGAGAVDLTHRTTHLVTNAANALTLAAGVQNLKKTITMVTDGGDGTLTATNGAFTSIVFNDVYDTVQLEYLNNKWVIVSNVGCTVT